MTISYTVLLFATAHGTSSTIRIRPLIHTLGCVLIDAIGRTIIQTLGGGGGVDIRSAE